MLEVQLPTVETAPFDGLAQALTRAYWTRHKDVSEMTSMANHYISQQHARRSEQRSEKGYGVLPFLSVLDDEGCPLELNGPSCMPPIMIGWSFCEFELKKKQRDHLGPDGFVYPDINGYQDYSEDSFWQVIPKAKDWEVELLMEVESWVRRPRKGLSLLSSAVQALLESDICLTKQRMISVGEGSDSH